MRMPWECNASARRVKWQSNFIRIPVAFHSHFTRIPFAFNSHSRRIPLAFHSCSTCIPLAFRIIMVFPIPLKLDLGSDLIFFILPVEFLLFVNCGKGRYVSHRHRRQITGGRCTSELQPSHLRALVPKKVQQQLQPTALGDARVACTPGVGA